MGDAVCPEEFTPVNGDLRVVPRCSNSVDVELMVIQEPNSNPGPPPPLRYPTTSTAAATVTQCPELPNHPQIQFIQEQGIYTVTDSVIYIDVVNEATKCYATGSSHNTGFSILGLDHRIAMDAATTFSSENGLPMKLPSVDFLQLSSMIELNGGSLKHVHGIFIFRSLQ